MIISRQLLLAEPIRGEVVKFEEDGRRDVGGIAAMRARLLVQELVFPARSGDRNTLRIGVIVIGPRPKP